MDQQEILKKKALMNYPAFTDVKSSNVKSIGYDCKGAIAVVKFNNGNEYAYFDVKEQEYNDLLLSESIGKALGAFKQAHEYVKIK